MLKVNEENLLLDHKELVEKKDKNLATITADAKAFAVAHCYDEKTTADFVAFTEKASGYGLSAEENLKLDILNSYIEVSVDIAEEEVAEATPVDNLNAQSATVNRV